jgi:hypothetical protein
MMRQFQTLTTTQQDNDSGIFSFSAREDGEFQPRLSLRREGEYVAISASYGAIEIALRPRYGDLKQAFAHLQPVTGLQTTRQVGSGEAFIALGLQDDGTLILRPTLVVDAAGRLSFNFSLTRDTYQALVAWLGG